MSEKYDLVVIGGGPGGLAAARRAAQKKKRVLLVEKNGWGGACAQRGCIPTKALLACCKYYTNIKKFKRLGVQVSDATLDFAAMQKHQRQMVTVAALGAKQSLIDQGVEARQAAAEFLSADVIRLTEADGQSQFVKADHALISWGAAPRLLSGIQLSPRLLTSDDVPNLTKLPSSIIIIGASFIGVEYATIFAELGVRVFLIEQLERILPQEDKEAADLLAQELKRLGVTIHTSATLTALEDLSGSVTIDIEKRDENIKIQAECALLCAGRKPLLFKEELDRLGLDYTENGILVDEKMAASAPGIYAAGDVTGGLMLAHRAARQAEAAVEGMFGGKPDYHESHIPSVVYSHPQIARVGLTEEQARKEGREIEVVKADYSANMIARAELFGKGFVKAIFERQTLIGAVVAGDSAAELILPLSLAVAAQLTMRQLRSWVIPHPTLGEVLTTITE